MASDTKRYQILPIKSEKKIDERWANTEDFLFRHSFVLNLVAPPRMGKSSVIMSLIYSPDFDFINKFDKVIYISPTVASDDTLRYLFEDDDVVKFWEGSDISNVDGILEEIIAQQKRKKDQQTLVVLDDMIASLKNVSIANISAMYRHLNLSLIITSQGLRALHPLLRNCASHYILFTTHNQKELEKLETEFCGYPSFLTHFREATRKRYSFLYIDQNKQRLMEKFDRVLFDKSMEDEKN